MMVGKKGKGGGRAREWEGEKARKSWKMAALSARTSKTELHVTS